MEQKYMPKFTRVPPAKQLVPINDIESLKKVKSTYDNKLLVVLFWKEGSQPAAHIKGVCEELAKVSDFLYFVAINTEEESTKSLVELYNITTIPTIAIHYPYEDSICFIKGDNVPKLNEVVDTFEDKIRVIHEKEKAIHFELIDKLVKSAPVFLFIKGIPTEPKCKFTNQLLDLIDDLGVEYGSYDILSNLKVREWGRLYSNWPTYPQVYIHGKLVGGLDVIRGLIEKGEFIKMVPKEAIKSQA